MAAMSPSSGTLDRVARADLRRDLSAHEEIVVLPRDLASWVTLRLNVETRFIGTRALGLEGRVGSGTLVDNFGLDPRGGDGSCIYGHLESGTWRGSPMRISRCTPLSAWISAASKAASSHALSFMKPKTAAKIQQIKRLSDFRHMPELFTRRKEDYSVQSIDPPEAEAQITDWLRTQMRVTASMSIDDSPLLVPT